MNPEYQKAALPLAKEKDIARVHLDAFFGGLSAAMIDSQRCAPLGSRSGHADHQA